VQDPGGQGIRKVKVVLVGGSRQRHEQYEAVTDETGQFKLQDVEPGTYLAQLQRAGYTANGKANRGSKLTITEDQDTKDLVFHMLIKAANHTPLQRSQSLAAALLLLSMVAKLRSRSALPASQVWP
jgi:hypothetical protein